MNQTCLIYWGRVILYFLSSLRASPVEAFLAVVRYRGDFSPVPLDVAKSRVFLELFIFVLVFDGVVGLVPPLFSIFGGNRSFVISVSSCLG